MLGEEDVDLDDGATYEPPTHLSGTPFADADVTDESFAVRTAQEEPEVSSCRSSRTTSRQPILAR